MVNTKKMHHDFITSLRNQIKDYKECIESNKKTILNSTIKLVEFKSLIYNTLKVKVHDVLLITNKRKLENLFKGKIKPLKASSQKIKYIKLLFNVVLKAKSDVKQLLDKIEQLKPKIINFKKYKFLVSNFNDMISDQIIKEGYTLKMGNHLGEIRIIKKKRPEGKKPINWQASNTAKAAILANGDIPYSKENAPDGKKWLVHFTEPFGYYWYWSKYLCTCTNRDSYSFKPTAGDYGNIKKLNQYRKHNPLVVIKYKV